MIFPDVNNGGILTYHHVYLSVEVWFILVRISWYVCSRDELSRQLLGTLANNNCPAGAPRMAHVYILEKKKKKNRLHRLVKNLFQRRSPCIISYSRAISIKSPSNWFSEFDSSQILNENQFIVMLFRIVQWNFSDFLVD
jgi:hypothetical protein